MVNNPNPGRAAPTTALKVTQTHAFRSLQAGQGTLEQKLKEYLPPPTAHAILPPAGLNKVKTQQSAAGVKQRYHQVDIKEASSGVTSS